MTEYFIEAKNLQKSFGNYIAVSDVSFQISSGDFFGLLGPNGAGKTTTIGMLTGLIPPTAGNVTIDGQSLKKNPNACKSKIGIVPQNFAFYPSLNAKDNLTFFGRIYGFHGIALKKRINDVLNTVVLSNHTKQPVDTFSNGMKRRLNIAIGLLNNPQVLILDEPTVGVDAHSRSAIFHSLKTLNKKGMTVIYTTHYMEEAQNLCNRIAIIDHGRIIRCGTPSSLIREYSNAVVKIKFGSQISPKLYEQLSQIASIDPLHKTNQRLCITSKNPEQTIEKVLSFPEVIKIGIESLDVSKPNLEDVFLHITGHSLRDNG